MIKKKFLISIALLGCILSCNKNMVQDFFEGFQKPSHFPDPVYSFNNNIVTKQGFELGKKLFYDPILSGNNTISCGSCHIQTSAFTHHGHIVSHGIHDSLGTRNSPPIMNLAWSSSFMWDGGIAQLDLQSIAPITNPIEMGETMPHVIEKLNGSAVYPTLFKKAFGSSQITGAVLLKALSQFMLLCISNQSKYDSVIRNTGSVFTPQEKLGYALVQQKCTPCHVEPLFTNHQFTNNGLSISAINDKGRFFITEQEKDVYKFKIPSLRNLAFTAPYMHDGRFFTLQAVLDHYSLYMKYTPNLDPAFVLPSTVGIVLTQTEKEQIIAFLNTLNDKHFVTNPLLSE